VLIVQLYLTNFVVVTIFVSLRMKGRKHGINILNLFRVDNSKPTKELPKLFYLGMAL